MSVLCTSKSLALLFDRWSWRLFVSAAWRDKTPKKTTSEVACHHLGHRALPVEGRVGTSGSGTKICPVTATAPNWVICLSWLYKPSPPLRDWSTYPSSREALKPKIRVEIASRRFGTRRRAAGRARSVRRTRPTSHRPGLCGQGLEI